MRAGGGDFSARLSLCLAFSPYRVCQGLRSMTKHGLSQPRHARTFALIKTGSQLRFDFKISLAYFALLLA